MIVDFNIESIGGGSGSNNDPKAIHFTQQSLSDVQKEQARANLSAEESVTREYDSQSPNGMGYVVLKKNQTLAEQVTLTNTVYEIRYDFDLGGASKTIPSGCVLMFNGGSLTNGTIVLDGTELSGKVSLDVDCSGTCINPSAWQGWFSSVDKFIGFINNVSGPQEYDFLPGGYNATTFISKGVDKYVSLNGNGCRLNFASQASSAAVFLYNKNQSITSSALTSIAKPGDRTVVVADASVFNIGDDISIRDTRTSSWSFYRDYQQGEFAEIIDIDTATNTITLDHPLFGNYAATNSYVYGYKGFEFNIQNLSVACDGGTLGNPTNGIYVRRAISGLFNSVSVEGFQNGLIVADSKNVSANNCVCNCPAIGGTGDGYGFRYNNSQTCSVIGGSFIGRNHGISIGGVYTGEFAIVNRNITIKETVANSERSGGQWASIDCHGDSEYVLIEGNICEGIAFAGKNIEVVNNVCLGVVGIYGSELISLNNTIKGNKVSRIYVPVSYDSGTTTNWTPETGIELLNIEGNEINYLGTGASTGTTFSSGMNGVYTNIDNVVVRLKDNVINGQMALQSFIGFGSSASTVDQTRTGKIILDGNTINTQSAYQRLFIAKEVIFRNNRVIAQSSQFLVYCDELVVDNNRLNPTSSFVEVPSGAPQEYKRLVFTNNIINSGKGISGAKLIGKIIVSGNVLSVTGGAQITNLSYSGSGSTNAIVTNNVVWDASDLTFGSLTVLSHGCNVSANTGAKVAPTATAASTVDLTA